MNTLTKSFEDIQEKKDRRERLENLVRDMQKKGIKIDFVKRSLHKRFDYTVVRYKHASSELVFDWELINDLYGADLVEKMKYRLEKMNFVGHSFKQEEGVTHIFLRHLDTGNHLVFSLYRGGSWDYDDF